MADHYEGITGAALGFDANVNTVNIGIHHSRFGKVLKERMDALKLPELYADGQRFGGGTPMTTIDFLKTHFGMSK